MKRETKELKRLRKWLEKTEVKLKRYEDENSPIKLKVEFICNRLTTFSHEFYQLFGNLFNPYDDRKAWTFEHFDGNKGTDYYNNIRLTAAWLFYHMVRADGVEELKNES